MLYFDFDISDLDELYFTNDCGEEVILTPDILYFNEYDNDIQFVLWGEEVVNEEVDNLEELKMFLSGTMVRNGKQYYINSFWKHNQFNENEIYE